MKKGYLSFVLAAIMLLCASVQMSASSESGFYTASDGLNITMQNDASYPWTVNENGQVQSNMHEDNGQTSITFTNNSGKDVKCLFCISVSSENNYDFMGYSSDGEEYQEISGEYGLNSRLLVLQDGNSITFKYRKDGSASSGNDCGYIENLRFLDEGELSNSELLALYLNNPNISIENDEYNPWGINEYGGIGVAYYNIGTTITFTNNSEEDITCHFTYCWPDNGIGSLSVSVNGRNSLYLDSDREYSFVIYSGNNISFSYYMGEDYGNDCEPAYLSYLQFTAPTQEDYEHTDIPDLSDLFSEYGVSIENNEYNPWKADENGGFYSTAYVTYQYSPLTFTNNSSNTLVCTMAISSGSENTPIYLSHGKKDYDYYEGYGDEQEIINTCNNEPITVHSIVLNQMNL